MEQHMCYKKSLRFCFFRLRCSTLLSTIFQLQRESGVNILYLWANSECEYIFQHRNRFWSWKTKWYGVHPTKAFGCEIKEINLKYWIQISNFDNIELDLNLILLVKFQLHQQCMVHGNHSCRIRTNEALC